MKAKDRHVTRIGKRNQVTIPAAMLRELGLSIGKAVEISTEGPDGEAMTIRLRSVAGAFNRVHGILARPGRRALTQDELEQAIHKARQDAATASHLQSLRG